MFCCFLSRMTFNNSRWLRINEKSLDWESQVRVIIGVSAGGCGWLAGNNWVETHNDSRDWQRSACNTLTHHSLETTRSINSLISHSAELGSRPNFHRARGKYSRSTEIFFLPHTSIFPLFFLDWSQRQERKVYLAIAALCIYSLDSAQSLTRPVSQSTVSHQAGQPGPRPRPPSLLVTQATSGMGDGCPPPWDTRYRTSLTDINTSNHITSEKLRGESLREDQESGAVSSWGIDSAIVTNPLIGIDLKTSFYCTELNLQWQK